MATSQVAVNDVIRASKLNEITLGTTAPSSPVDGWLWAHTNAPKPILRLRAVGADNDWINVPQQFTDVGSSTTPTSTTFIAVASIADMQFDTFWDYQIFVIGQYSAGGASVKDLQLRLARVTGTATASLMEGMMINWQATGAPAVITPSGVGGSAFVLTGAGNLGATGNGGAFLATYRFGVTGTGMWQWQVAHDGGAEASNPSLTRISVSVVRAVNNFIVS